MVELYAFGGVGLGLAAVAAGLWSMRAEFRKPLVPALRRHRGRHRTGRRQLSTLELRTRAAVRAQAAVDQTRAAFEELVGDLLGPRNGRDEFDRPAPTERNERRYRVLAPRVLAAQARADKLAVRNAPRPRPPAWTGDRSMWGTPVEADLWEPRELVRR